MNPELKSEIQTLRKVFPPLYPVRVYFRDRSQMDHSWGDCELVYGQNSRPSHFRIRLCRGQSLAFTQYLLRHEWAHAVAWREGHETVCDHDPEWALAFARIYQDIVEP